VNALKRYLFHKKNVQSGATLLFIIVLIVVLSFIALGLFSLISTSQLNQVEAQKSAKAYYISESCLRVVASEYRAATDKNARLITLNGRTLTMPSNQGSCALTIFPYWFYAPSTVTISSGATTISSALFFPGTVPMIDDGGTNAISLTFPATTVTAKLKKRNSSTEVYEFTGATIQALTGNGTGVNFTLKTALTSAVTITAGDEFYLGATYTMPSASTTLTAGGNLVIKLNADDSTAATGRIFPPTNGSIFFDTTGVPQIRYDSRTVNTSVSPRTVTLTNIQAIGSTALPVTITGSTMDIYMGKSMGIRSQSTYGN